MSQATEDKQAAAFDHNKSWQAEGTAESYDEQRFRSLGGRMYDRMEKAAILKLLDTAKNRAPVHTVLDLPCGTGRISEFLASQGFELSCADNSAAMIEVAKTKLESKGFTVQNYSVLDIYATGLPDDGFDCISCIRLFQHLTSEERARALRELARISKRFVLVNVMFTSTYYGAVRTLRRALGRYTTRQVSSEQEIQQEIDFAGLKIVDSIFTQPGFNGNRVLLLEKV